MRRERRLGLIAGTLVLTVAGCGGGRPVKSAALILDFTPNAVHSGIYTAVARGYDRAAGVRLDVRVPSMSTDSVKLLLGGRADFAVLDIHDLALARARGRDLVGVMALVQRPLAAVLAQPSVRSPRDLQGRRAGVSGLPSDSAVLRSIVSGAGGNPKRVREVTIGFNAVPSLLGGRVAGATAFWNVEGVALQRQRPGFRQFRVDDYGAPRYPELVLTTTRRELRHRAGVVRATVAALVRGYSFARKEPWAAVENELARAPGLKRDELRAQMKAVSPAFATGAGRPGELNSGRLKAWARWEARFGIVSRPPDVGAMFDTRFLPR
ncbi:MAG TPA: ABC transporter substrate-binding protein [Solirubrobacteraceae bacterium]|nr:ABC transporter substrate-binding protein [Solirubrobacteraceae bacterium]